jgi:preprotein translocase subunit SecG
MQTVIIMVHLMIVIALIGFVLLQRSEGGGLGSGSSGASFMSSRGTANVLTRTTAFLAVAFFATSLILSVIAGMDRKPSSILPGNSPAPAGQSQDQPLAPSGGGLLDTLRGAGAGQGGQAPAAPSGPQVPQSR